MQSLTLDWVNVAGPRVRVWGSPRHLFLKGSFLREASAHAVHGVRSGLLEPRHRNAPGGHEPLWRPWTPDRHRGCIIFSAVSPNLWTQWKRYAVICVHHFFFFPSSLPKIYAVAHFECQMWNWASCSGIAGLC